MGILMLMPLAICVAILAAFSPFVEKNLLNSCMWSFVFCYRERYFALSGNCSLKYYTETRGCFCTHFVEEVFPFPKALGINLERTETNFQTRDLGSQRNR